MRRTAENVHGVGREVKRLRAIEVLNDAQVTELSKTALERFPTPAAVKSTIDALVREWDGVDNHGNPRAPTPHELGQMAPKWQE